MKVGGREGGRLQPLMKNKEIGGREIEKVWGEKERRGAVRWSEKA